MGTLSTDRSVPVLAGLTLSIDWAITADRVVLVETLSTDWAVQVG